MVTHITALHPPSCQGSLFPVLTHSDSRQGERWRPGRPGQASLHLHPEQQQPQAGQAPPTAGRVKHRRVGGIGRCKGFGKKTASVALGHQKKHAKQVQDRSGGKLEPGPPSTRLQACSWKSYTCIFQRQLLSRAIKIFPA